MTINWSPWPKFCLLKYFIIRQYEFLSQHEFSTTSIAERMHLTNLPVTNFGHEIAIPPFLPAEPTVTVQPGMSLAAR